MLRTFGLPLDFEAGRFFAKIESFESLGDGRRLLHLDAVRDDETLRRLLDTPGVVADYWGALNAGIVPEVSLYAPLDSIDIAVEVGPEEGWAPEPADPSWFEIEIGHGDVTEQTPLLMLVSRDPGVPMARDVPMQTLRGGTVPIPTDGEMQVLLDRLFTVDNWGSATDEQVMTALSRVKAVVQAIAFDVGQGTSIALIDETGHPALYVDLGRGATGEADTAPDPLRFCFDGQPPIVLTHWHKDHWYGMRDAEASFTSTWVVPHQEVGVEANKLSDAIKRAKGKVLVVKTFAPITVDLKPSSAGQKLTLQRMTGAEINDSGLAVTVERKATGKDPKTAWLFVGDGGYAFLQQIPERVSVLAASHHGGDQPGEVKGQEPGAHIVPPRRPDTGYARLLYSYGAGNSYDHPMADTIAAHIRAGWKHPTTGSRADSPGEYDVLATSTKAPEGNTKTDKRSAIAAGWTKQPPPPKHLLECLKGLKIEK